MKVFARRKDGGPLSKVTGYWLVEAKRLCSVLLLRFGLGSREAYHSHAFNSINWVLRGKLVEYHLDGRCVVHTPSWRPVVTKRDTFHRVFSMGTTWVFSLRGPWARLWQEYLPDSDEVVTLTSGRVEVARVARQA